MNAERRRNILLLLGLAIGGASCATVQPTPMLVQAREHFGEAKAGPAQKLVPDRVYEARVALQKAERAHENEPGSDYERHLAYLADRKALVAISEGETRAARNRAIAANRAMQTVLLSQRNEAQSRLGRAEMEMQQEHARRMAADASARLALQSLSEIAQVREEGMRTIVTLPGGVLFTSGKADILSSAKPRLDRVADALKSHAADRRVVIEGHADARGSDAFNQALSERRAQAVRDYLVGRGVQADKLQAIGKGEMEPVAKNDTAENRANNRRVEIEIEKAPGE